MGLIIWYFSAQAQQTEAAALSFSSVLYPTEYQLMRTK